MHHKHPKLVRPDAGHYARTEFALVGSTCARMEALMDEWLGLLSDDFRCTGVTARHDAPAVPQLLRHGKKVFSSHHAGWNDYDDRLYGKDFDLALVNGNHFPADRQIVFVDAAKAGTLERRAEQLTDVAAVIFCDDNRQLPPFLAERITAATLQLPLSDAGGVVEGIRAVLNDGVPPLRALLLAGGESSRMGTDKGALVYRDGQPEVVRLAGLCTALGLESSLSLRDPAESETYGLPVVADRFLGLGPAGAIASGFLHDPNTAWLVLACDLPLLDVATLEGLIAARRPGKFATALRAPGREWPEPLVAIYEPRAYARLLRFLGLGYACPRKMLINSDVATVELADGRPVTNANTPGERAGVLRQLTEKTA